MLKNMDRLLFIVVLVMTINTIAFAGTFLVKAGMQGENVKQVQVLLIAQGFLDDEADGVCGRKTTSAIKKFQQVNGLSVDGIVGSQTYDRLKHNNSEQACPADGKVIYVSATAYSAHDLGNSSYTASGTLVRHGIIAVDPSFIALGSRVYIPGYGEAIAEDVGWGIKGNRIDVAFDTHEEALVFGRQDLELYLID